MLVRLLVLVLEFSHLTLSLPKLSCLVLLIFISGRLSTIPMTSDWQFHTLCALDTLILATERVHGLRHKQQCVFQF